MEYKISMQKIKKIEKFEDGWGQIQGLVKVLEKQTSLTYSEKTELKMFIQLLDGSFIEVNKGLCSLENILIRDDASSFLYEINTTISEKLISDGTQTVNDILRCYSLLLKKINEQLKFIRIKNIDILNRFNIKVDYINKFRSLLEMVCNFFDNKMNQIIHAINGMYK